MDLQDPDNTFMLDADDDAALQQSLAETRIWGTDLNVQTCMNVFGVFLEFFGVGLNGNPLSFYQQQLEYMNRTGDYLLNLNCSHLKAFPGKYQNFNELYKYVYFAIVDNVYMCALVLI